MTTILLSYNEVQSLARKAASGAGLPHGVAEEIGHAAVWLSARGVDAIRVVVDALGDEAQGRQAVLRGQAAIDALCCGETEQGLPEDQAYSLLLIGLAGAAAMDTGLNLTVQQGNGDVAPLARVSDVGGLLLSQVLTLYFTPVLWPDFRRADLYTALSTYGSRERRFGLTSEQLRPGRP